MNLSFTIFIYFASILNYDICKTFGNDIHLASVHSGEEQSFIQSAVHDNLWIGGSRMSSSAGFSWSDQSKFDFIASNWRLVNVKYVIIPF